MASVARRANPFHSTLPWRRFKLRTICGRRIARAPSSSTAEAESEAAIAGKKILETFTEEFEIGSRKITLETGKLARFANGPVVLAMEETKVLSTVASAKTDGSRDSLPLIVEYQEKQFAQGVIPGTFMRREGIITRVRRSLLT